MLGWSECRDVSVTTTSVACSFPLPPPGPQWLRDWIGVDYFAKTVGVVLPEASQIEDLSPLSQLTSVEHLCVDRTGITDLSPISSLKNLVHLALAHTPVTDLSPISSLKKLEYLDVTHASD